MLTSRDIRMTPPVPPAASLRELLFGDVPLAQWGGASRELPWIHFQDAAFSLASGDTAGARAALLAVLEMIGLESRHYLQAWTTLRELGMTPPPNDAHHLYGVVFDVPVEHGLDRLVAYDDGNARYLNYSGAAIVWEGEDPAIASLVTQALTASRGLLQHAGPWGKPRPALPRIRRGSACSPRWGCTSARPRWTT